MLFRIAFLCCWLCILLTTAAAQCINTFPYNEGFEIDDGGWVSGGAGNDWAWGGPSKPVIAAAGGGTKCWIVGGLTGNSYTSLEASWLQSPCFDLSTVQYPYIEFKVNWETEQQFDGGSFQYSLDGISWTNVGSASDADNCLHENWFNFSPINFLSSFSSSRDGWSGNIQTGGGSCRNGNGSNGWVTAKHTMPYLAGEPLVLFRFVFGAGSICNNFDGFAIDDVLIGEAPPNKGSFTYTCNNAKTISFLNTSSLCPGSFSWDFGDPGSGANNTSSGANPVHSFSAPGKYTVTLTVSGPGNAPSTIQEDIIVIDASVVMISPVDCQTNTGGSLMADVDSPPGTPLNFLWNSNPPQSGTVISGLAEGSYTVTISGMDLCPVTVTGKAEKDLSCIAVFFPTGFTPDNNRKNDGFGPLGSLSSISNYQLSIYNRWGQRVFFSRDPFEKWKGSVRGVKTDGNVFAWFAEYLLPGKGREFRKGTVVLIR